MNAIELRPLETSNGRKTLRPADNNQESMKDFQSAAKPLIYCSQQAGRHSSSRKKEVVAEMTAAKQSLHPEGCPTKADIIQNPSPQPPQIEDHKLF